MQDTRWHSLQGGMQTVKTDDGRELVEITAWGRNRDGLISGVRVSIEPRRLEQHYARTLHFLMRDLEAHDIV